MSDDGEILMGRWDCTSCGTRGVLGDAYSCSGCGAPRPEDVRFYLPDDAARIEDTAGIAAATAGPDWQCAFCDRWNPATVSACASCAASHADSERKQREREFVAGDVPRSSDDVEPSRPVSPAPRVARPVRSGPAIPRAALVGVALFLLASLGACLVFAKIRSDRLQAYHDAVEAQRAVVATAKLAFDEANAPLIEASAALRDAEHALAEAKRALLEAQQALAHTEADLRRLGEAPEGRVVAHHWEVAIGVERCAAQPGEGWSHPRDAFEVHSEQRVHHTERVLDRIETRYREETYREQDGFDTETYTEREATGTRQVPDGHTVTDLGNGRFEKTPRYRTETVYEQVTKTRQVPRYVQKTRQIPYEEKIYRDDPVHQPWFRYSTWVWRAGEPLARRGEGLTVADPAGTPASQVAPQLGALRTISRSVEYTLVLGFAEGERAAQEVVLAEERWRAFADGDPALRFAAEVLSPAERDARVGTLEERRVGQRSRIPPLAARIGPLEEPLPELRAALAPLAEATRPFREALEQERNTLAVIEHDRP